ncbi:MAG: hypothetical protein ABIH04_00380 [Planctomycetota bacterium]
MSGRKQVIFIAGAIVLLSVGFFWKVWLRPGEMMSPGRGDLAELFAPRKAYQVENTLATGELTMWDPYSDSGAPVVGNIQNGTFYPLYILFYLLPTNSAFGYIFWANMALGGLFCYAFLRSLERERPAAFFGACVYMFAGVWATKLLPGHVMVYNNFPWIPLAFFCARKSITSVSASFRRGLFYALLGSIVLMVQFFGGHTQFFLYSTFFLGLYCAFEILRNYVVRESSRPFAAIALIVLMLAVFVPLVAIQLLPALEFASLVMPEGGMDFSEAARGIFSRDRWVMFAWPEFFGSPAKDNYLLGDPYWEICPYIGIIPLLLMWAGLWLRRGAERWFFLFMAVVTVLFAMGNTGPVYPILGPMPGFSAFRVPARMLSMFLLPAAVLASAGMEGLLRQSKRLASTVAAAAPALFLCALAVALSLDGSAGLMRMSSSVWTVFLAAVTVAALFVSVFGQRLRRVAFCVLFLSVLFDLFIFSEPYLQTSPPSEVYHEGDAVLDYLKERGDGIDFRVYEFKAGLDYKQFRYARMNMVTGDIDRSKLTYMLDYWDHMNILTNSMYRALNVHYIVTTRNLEQYGLDSRQVGGVYVTENPGAMPRAFVVGCVRSFENVPDEEILVAISGVRKGQPEGKPMNLRRCAAIEEKGEFALDRDEEARPAKVVKEKYRPNRIVVEMELDKPGFLVLSEVWYPGWKAQDTVGGATRSKKVYKTNVLLRGVFLEEGKHKVEFYFDSESFRTGRTITFIALPALLVLLLVVGVKAFRKQACSR